VTSAPAGWFSPLPGAEKLGVWSWSAMLTPSHTWWARPSLPLVFTEAVMWPA